MGTFVPSSAMPLSHHRQQHYTELTRNNQTSTPIITSQKMKQNETKMSPACWEKKPFCFKCPLTFLWRIFFPAALSCSSFGYSFEPSLISFAILSCCCNVDRWSGITYTAILFILAIVHKLFGHLIVERQGDCGFIFSRLCMVFL